MKKKALLYFIIGVVIFTFVSKSLDSMTVAKVSVQTPKKKSMEIEISADGKIESTDERFIIADTKAVIGNIYVKQYEQVNEGDLLYTYTMESLESLFNDKTVELDKLKLSLKELELGNVTDAKLAEGYFAEQDLERANEKLSKAYEEYDNAQNEYNNQKNDAKESYNKKKEQAKSDYKALKKELDNNKKEEIKALDKSDESYEKLLKEIEDNYNSKLIEAEKQYNQNLEAYKAEYVAGIGELSNMLDAGAVAIEGAADEADIANQNLANANLADENTRKNEERQTQIGALSEERIKLDIEQINKELEELNLVIEQEGKIHSPYSGIVTDIEIKLGKTALGEELIKFAGEELIFRCSVLKEEAKYLKAGTEGKININGKNSNESLSGEIAAIDLKSDEKLALLTVNIKETEGDLVLAAGSFKVNIKTEPYSTCIPLQAVYNGSDGDYCLVVNEKSTVLGEENTARKVKINIIDKDNSTAAVTGELSETDYVITEYSKYISENDRVRVIW